MRIEFKEEFSLPVQVIFDYFKTPNDWSRLYGAFGAVIDKGDGWYAVPLKRFPFPLMAKITALKTNRLVHWQFKGFWRGEGEVRFNQSNGKVTVEGYEEISILCLFMFSPIVEKLFIQRRFEKVWRYGWRKLHQQEGMVQSLHHME